MSTAMTSDDTPSRSQILRDVLIFQAKLWLEGFKDFVLMPLSFVAAVLDFVFRRGTHGGALYSVMELGDRFERWVDLYAALDEQPPDQNAEPSPRSLDALLNEAADGIEKKASSDSFDRTDSGPSRS